MDSSTSKSSLSAIVPSTLRSPLGRNSPTVPITNISNVSRSQTTGPIDPLSRDISDRSLPTQPIAPHETLLRDRYSLGKSSRTISPLKHSTQQQNRQAQHQSEADRTDALWAEMQATLAEVELSAAGSTHFFGPAHGAALEELRKSQIALAQAWARSETGDEVVDQMGVSEKSSQRSPGASMTGENRANADDDDDDAAEGDILLARKRREANDRYFSRVSKGVVDVVGRLEEVALAMVKVEKESQEIWNESESMDTESRLS